MRSLHDRHVEGIFPEADWLRALGDAGFAAQALRIRHSEVDHEIPVFVGISR